MSEPQHIVKQTVKHIREFRGLALDDVVMDTTLANIAAWESADSDDLPDYEQGTRLAELLNVPYVAFFLPYEAAKSMYAKSWVNSEWDSPTEYRLAQRVTDLEIAATQFMRDVHRVLSSDEMSGVFLMAAIHGAEYQGEKLHIEKSDLFQLVHPDAELEDVML